MSVSERRPAMAVIKPTMFYSCKKEKVKFNWFCYELSMAIYDEITDGLEKMLNKNRITDRKLADFSVWISKKMKCLMLERLSGQRKDVGFSYEMVEHHFPNLGDDNVNEMLDSLCDAWSTLFESCVTCPTRCITERNVYCTMFDNEDF